MNQIVSSGDWVRQFHPKSDPDHYIVCFPHAGGSASYYFPLSREMPDSVDTLVVQYPGRHDRHRETAFEEIDHFIGPVVSALEPYLHRPITFFGHSLGALIGFEVARRMQERETRLAGFFASGRRGPTTWRDESAQGLSDDEFLAEVRALDGTDAQVFNDDELIRMFLPTLRSDYAAAENYRYVEGQRLECPIVVLTGDDDPKCTLPEARTWAEHAADEFDLKVFGGGHFFLEGYVPEIVGLLTQHVARSSSKAA